MKKKFYYILTFLLLTTCILGVEKSYAVEDTEVGITCSGGNSGGCFTMTREEGLLGSCRTSCTFTGAMEDSCSAFAVFIANMCDSNNHGTIF